MAVKKTRRVISKVVASNSTYIDPLNCDSTVSYKIIKRGSSRAWGSVQLSDCTRKIEWYFGNDQPVDKINNAIAVLEEFRDALVKIRKDRRAK